MSLLKSAEANPMEYTLADPDDACSYARLLLQVLDQVTGPSSGSGKCSEFSLELSNNSASSMMLGEEEALQVYYEDSMGVCAHYCVSKLYEVITVLQEAAAAAIASAAKPLKPTSSSAARISIRTTFYNKEGLLLDDWRPLLRLLYMGGTGDPFAQRKYTILYFSILVMECIMFAPSILGLLFSSKFTFASRAAIP
jgi:hypothetical protein